MSETLGRYVVAIEAQTEKFESDTGRAARLAEKNARAIQKSFEDGFKRMEESARSSMSGIKGALGALTGFSPGELGIAAVGTALGEVTRRAIETGDQFNKMSQKTGIGVAALSGIAYAGELADVSIEALSGSMAKFARTASEAAGGSKEQAAAFAAIGVSVKAADGTIRPMEQLLGDVAEKFAGYKDGAEKTALAMALFGKSGAEMIPLLNAGRDGLAEASAEAKALGFNFEAIAKPSEDFNDNLTRMSKAAIGIGADIAGELLPSLIAGEERILSFLKAARENGYLQDFAKGVAYVVTNLDTLAVTIGSRLVLAGAVSAFSAVTAAVTSSAAAIGIFNGALALVGGPVGAIALAAGALYFLSTRTDEAERATNSLKEAQDRLRGATDETRKSEAQAAAQKLELARAAVKATEAQIAQLEAMAAQNRRDAQQFSNLPNASGAFSMGAGAAMDGVAKLKEHLAGLKEELNNTSREISIADALTDLFGETAKKATPNVGGLGKANDDAAKAAERLSETVNSAKDFLDTLAGKAGGAYTKAWAEYSNSMNKAADIAAKMTKNGASLANVQKFIADATALANEAFQSQFDLSASLDTAITKATGELTKHRAALALTAEQQAVNEQFTRLLGDAEKTLLTVMGPLTEADQKRIDTLRSLATGIVGADKAADRYAETLRQNQEVTRGWIDIFQSGATNAMHSFADAIVNGGKVLSGLGDLARNVVSQIISYFGQLSVINPILNAVFGRSMIAGGGALLPTLANASGIFGSGSSAAGGASPWNMAAQWASSKGTGFGLDSFLGPSFLGSGTGSQSLLGSLFGKGSFDLGWGNALSSGGGLGGALGTLGGVFGGWQLGNRLGGTAGGLAGAAGLGAASYFVPVIGWIAGIASLIDKLTGGGLFGTDANKFVRGESDLNVGANGATVGIGADFKGKKSFFGGSYHEWKVLSPSQEQIAAANAFYKALSDQANTFAKKFGLTAGEVASGTFRQEFDKAGKITATKSIVGGVEYQGETQEQFAQRIGAESFIATLKKIGVDVTAYTQQFIKDAEAYAQAAQDAATSMQYAQRDLKNGVDISGGKGLQGSFDLAKQYQDASDSITSTYQRLSVEARNIKQGLDILVGPDTVAGIETFLRTVQDFGESLAQTYDRIAAEAADLAAGTSLLTGQGSVAEIEAYIRTMQAGGESLAQTYQRLIQASDNYRQFVGQFTPTATYVDDFEAALSGVHAQLLANIKTANDLAKAAGLAGATQKDLANIMAFAKKQAEALEKQLRETARGLAYSMGLIGPYTLDQVNQEISDLKSKANSSSTAVQDFGRAMTDTANRASEAMNLLLGDLSPLNDREKLQTALSGLRSGTVSQEEVLQIGRRLYASSQAYNDLFRMVQQFAPRGSSVASDSGSGKSPNGSLSAADLKRLEDLEKQRAVLMKQQDYIDAQNLAKMLAEITASTGEDFEDVLKGWGATTEDLAKRLKFDNEDQLRAFIESQQKLLDSNGENSTIIADWLEKIFNAIDRGGITFNSPGDRNHQNGSMRDDDKLADTLDRIGRSIDRSTVAPVRNRRPSGTPYA